ncbi:MAG TPA: SDR family oxidoreductase, partial [Solirubrobacteraceae bacterium]|nr:SDR family oxidoreductase [Solirubrobacteraceae bacterium]
MGGLPEPRAEGTALVTGASAGIGAEIARELARRGHGLTLVARRRERLEELAGELAGEHGVRAEVLPCDLTDPKARGELPGRVAALGLDVDVLVNNAGFGTSGCFHEADVDREVQQVRILVEAVVDLTGRFVPGMVERRRGAILNVASTAGYAPLPRMAGYGAAKAWARSFTQAIHEELKPHGIAVTALCPGPVETEFFDVSGPTPIENVIPKPAWVDAEHCARVGVDGLARNRVEVVPGRAMQAIVAAGRITPHEIRGPLFGRFFR